MAALNRAELTCLLEGAYARFNRREFALQDPIRYVYDYPEPADGEVVGLLSGLLAFGRVAQILRSVEGVLGRLGERPAEFVRSSSPRALRAACVGFVHRTANADNMACLLVALKGVLERHGSLESCFRAHDEPGARTVLPGLTGLAGELCGGAGHLTADPRRGSPCKRWNLFLRWMVRRDEVDPGLWRSVSAARLIVPLDTHMWRVCKGLGLTRRATCNMKAALEVTDAFRVLRPEDPVRYDFSLMHASVENALPPLQP